MPQFIFPGAFPTRKTLHYRQFLNIIYIMSNKKSESKEVKTEEKLGFFQNLFSSLFGGGGPDAEKKRKLKSISKTFSKCKYHSYFKPGSSEATGSFGKLMYDIYKVVSQAQVYFKNIQNPNIFKAQIINYNLTEQQLNLLEHFDEQKIIEMTHKLPVEKVHAQLEEELQVFNNSFDSERLARTENLFKALSLFKDFCCFDYYVIIKKYDASFQEYNFTNTPRLEKINAEYILDDLKDFVSISYAITDESVVWTDLFEFFKQTQGKELLALGTWKKIIAKIRSIQTSHAFDMMIQLIAQDPTQSVKTNFQTEPILEPYIDKIQNDVYTTLDKIETQQKESKTNNLCMQIFGSEAPQSLNYFVPGFNAVLEKKDLELLEYTEPLNYLKCFILEFVKKEVREFYDVVVIRGQWDATLSAPTSNAYQDLLKTSDLISIFDEDFSEEGASGMKIKTLLPKTAHDSGAESIINRVVSDANEQARGYLVNSTQNLITIGKTIKQLVEDLIQPKPTIVMNWKELDKYVEAPIKEFMVGMYKKIYLFVQLMQQYL